VRLSVLGTVLVPVPVLVPDQSVLGKLDQIGAGIGIPARSV
jgi:hypothetical protein